MIGSRDAYVACVAFIQQLIFQDSRASFFFLGWREGEKLWRIMRWRILLNKQNPLQKWWNIGMQGFRAGVGLGSLFEWPENT